MGGTVISLDLAASPAFTFIVQNLDFQFGDILEIRAGQFSIGSGSFSGTGLEIFVGKGPSKLDDGSTNPDAIGLLIRNASLAFINNPNNGFAIKVTGTLALLGLDGLSVSGTVAFEANTSTQALTPPGSSTPLVAGRYSFIATGVSISVAGIFAITGNLGPQR